MRASDFVCVLALAALGCSHNPAPSGWLRSPADAPSDPYGAWIEIEPRGERAHRLSGEFLATSADSLYLLDASGAVQSIAAKDVQTAVVAYYDSQWGKLGVATAFGTASTLSHGYFLIFTAPAWIITGTVVTGQQSNAPLVRADGVAVLDLGRTYARFPGGLPPNLPRRLPQRYDLEAP
jgi:hypothetical protein